jgi:hypothetical protein
MTRRQLQLTPTLRQPELHHHLREQTTGRIRLPRPHAPPQSMSAHKPEFPGNVAPEVLGSGWFSKEKSLGFSKRYACPGILQLSLCRLSEVAARSRHRNSTAATITGPSSFLSYKCSSLSYSCTNTRWPTVRHANASDHRVNDRSDGHDTCQCPNNRHTQLHHAMASKDSPGYAVRGKIASARFALRRWRRAESEADCCVKESYIFFMWGWEDVRLSSTLKVWNWWRYIHAKTLICRYTNANIPWHS